MDTKTLINDALKLSVTEKLFLMEVLSNSLSQPDNKIDEEWKLEVEKRIDLLSKNKVKTIPISEIEKKWG